jgi:hypothetical protein
VFAVSNATLPKIYMIGTYGCSCAFSHCITPLTSSVESEVDDLMDGLALATVHYQQQVYGNMHAGF